MVILTAVIIGVWSMIFLGSLMRGIADQMVRNGIATLTGHIQVHRKGYRDDPVIENSITEPGAVEAALHKSLSPMARWTSRVRVSAIASNARHSSGIILVGIDPQREARVSFIGQGISEGRFLEADDKHGIVVGKVLLDNFETKLGHKMVLMSKDTDLQPRAIWDITQDVQLTFGGNVFYGAKDTEFGGFRIPDTDLLNKPSDSGFLWLTYFF